MTELKKINILERLGDSELITVNECQDAITYGLMQSDDRRVRSAKLIKLRDELVQIVVSLEYLLSEKRIVLAQCLEKILRDEDNMIDYSKKFTKEEKLGYLSRSSQYIDILRTINYKAMLITYLRAVDKLMGDLISRNHIGLA